MSFYAIIKFVIYFLLVYLFFTFKNMIKVNIPYWFEITILLLIFTLTSKIAKRILE